MTTTTTLTTADLFLIINALREAATRHTQDATNPNYVQRLPDLIEIFKQQARKAEELAALFDKLPIVTIEDEG